MSGTIRVGVVGANPTRGWAQTAHLPALAALEGFEVTAVSTTRIESAEQTAAEIGAAHAFASATELATCPDVDVVTICVRVPHHHELVQEAITAGKHVFCEWPLGADSAEAEDLTRQAESAGLRHVIGLQGRKSPMLNYVRHLVGDGYLGTVRSATVTFVVSGRGGPTIAPDRVWTADRRAGVTLLTVPGGHTLDCLRYCLGEFSEVSASVATLVPTATIAGTAETVTVSAPDNVLVRGALSNGALFGADFLSSPSSLGTRIVVNGDEGSLVLDGGASIHLSDDGFHLRAARAGASLEELVPPASFDTVPDSVPSGAPRNVAGLYLALADVLDGVGNDLPDFHTALSMHRVLDAIETSSSDRAVVRV